MYEGEGGRAQGGEREGVRTVCVYWLETLRLPDRQIGEMSEERRQEEAGVHHAHSRGPAIRRYANRGAPPHPSRLTISTWLEGGQ